MSNFKNNQRGFSPVESILVLVIIAMIAGVGWYVYRAMKNTNNAYSSATVTSTSGSPKFGKATKSTTATKTYTDQSNVYTVSYPASWTLGQGGGGGDTHPAALLDELAATLTPPNAPDVGANDPNAIDIQSYRSSDTAGIMKFYITGDGNTTPRKLTINGYDAVYQQSIGGVGKSSIAYTDDNYVVTHNGVTVVFFYRVKQSATQQDNIPPFDVSSTVAAFTDVVKSIKFLN